MHPVLAALADRQDGLFTAADAHRSGYGGDEIRSHLSTGRWIRLRRGVYATAETGARLTTAAARHRADCLAILLSLARHDAAVSHASAARLWGVPVFAGLDPTPWLTDPQQWRRGEGYRIVRAPLHADEVQTIGALRLTRPTRTLVDCARTWPLEDSVVALDASLLRGRTTPEALRAALSGQHQWPGVPAARRAVALADGRAESPLETLGRLRVVGAGLPPDALQVEIRAGGRLVAVVDAWYDRAAVALEFDGKVKYVDPWRGRDPRQVLWEEKRREDELRALDIRVVRVADADLGSRWRPIEERLTGLVRSAGPADRRFTATPRRQGVLRESA